MRITTLLTCIGVFFACQVSISQASIITLDPVDSGQLTHFRQSFLYPPYPVNESYRHDVPLTEVAFASYRSAGCLCAVSSLVYGYAIYDLSSLGFVVQGASLELDLDASGISEFLAINTMDAFTPSELSALPSGGVGGLPLALGEALAQDISSGIELGSVDLTAGTGIYPVDLNNTAVDLINSTNGLMAIGFNYLPAYETGITQVLFNRGPRLILHDGLAVVSQPGTLYLCLLGAILLTIRIRSQRPAY